MPKHVPDPASRIPIAATPSLAGIIAGLECKGLSKAAIAREAGCSRAYVSLLAAGERGLGRVGYGTVQAFQQVAADHGVTVQARRIVTPPAPVTAAPSDPAPLVWRRPD